MDRIKNLENKIKKHRELYYNSQPEISDQEFDGLIDKLRKLKPNSPVLKQVGSSPKRHKTKLPLILGSLDKTNVGNVTKWMAEQKDSIFASLKMDGLSIYAEWINGELKLASTRGDGEIGENITSKMSHIKDFPICIDIHGRFAARGEAVLIGAMPSGYKTRRNAASGIMNRDDSQNMNKIAIIFHELLMHPDMSKFDSEVKRIKEIERIGLEGVPWILIHREHVKHQSTIEMLVNIIKEKEDFMKEKGARKFRTMDVDGIVLSKNSSKRENVKIPKNKIAFKIDDIPVETKVTEIEWSITRSNFLIPIVHVDVTEINGVEIEHPTGHNFKWIKDKSIGIGSRISIIRSGDVIPYIKSVLRKGTFTYPKRCPTCQKPTKIEGVHLTCTNKSCKGAALMQIEYFLRTLGAENISAKTIEKLSISNIMQFYELSKNEISSVDGLGEISAETILKERNKTLRTTPQKLLAAFGIPHIGLKIAEKIVNELNLKTLDLLFKKAKLLSEAILNIEGIGPAIAESFYVNLPEYYLIYTFLKEKGLKFIKEEKTTKLIGLTFCFTGTMEKPREEIEKLVSKNGGEIKNVSRKLDYLVTNDENSTSTKAMKARELGIKIISEKQFREMI